MWVRLALCMLLVLVQTVEAQSIFDRTGDGDEFPSNRLPVLRGATGGKIPSGKETAESGTSAGNDKVWLKPSLPMFTKDTVARESPQEQIEALQNPTNENAHRAAIAKLYRNYKMMLASEMIARIQTAIFEDTMRRHGLTHVDTLEVLEIIAREHDLPTYGAMSKVDKVVSDEIAKVMRQILGGGK